MSKFKTAAIIGASGGIGGELARQLIEAGVDLDAFSRSGAAVEGAARSLTLDVTDEASIAEAVSDLPKDRTYDLVIVASGLLADGEKLQPEKSFKQQDPDAYARVFGVNTIGPALIAKHLLPRMPRKAPAVFAALSARVGSIGDNRIGGWHAYRASKAALNMLIRNFAIEQARRNDQFICVGLHPGTVDTALSEPFQGNVPDEQLQSPGKSAGHLLSVLEGLKPEDTGKVFDWAGEIVPP